MKKSFLLVITMLVSFWLTPTLSHAQYKPASRKPAQTEASTTPQNLLKINPLSLFAVTATVAYERVIYQQMSAQLGFFYTFPSIKIANTRFQGFGITPEFRYYFAAVSAPKGLYIAPFLRYQRFILTYDDPESNQYDGEATFRATGVGAVVGGQWIFAGRFSVDAFIGLVGNGFTLKTDVPGLKDRVKIPIAGAVSPRLGLTVGMAF